MKFFKRAYLPYLMVVAGVALIFLWARARKTEGFEDKAPAPASSTPDYTFHMYYADWCPHCQSAKPEFAELGAIQTIGGKTIACEAIEAEKNPEKVKTKVSSYPTIHLYDAAGKLVQEYKGPRTASDFQAFLEEAVLRQ